MADRIVSEQVVVRWDGLNNRPGVLLTMADGSRWFHPYSGAKPVREPQGAP